MTFKKRARLDDWEQQLFTFLNEARNRSVNWGEFDCAIGLVAGAIKAQTGVDLSLEHIGEYADPKEAHRYMRESGWGSLEEMMDAFLMRAKWFHRGNIVLIYTDDWQGFGVRIGRNALAFGPNGGLHEYSIPNDSPEWSVI